MRPRLSILCLIILCACALAQGAIADDIQPEFTAVPNVLRPGKYYDIVVNATQAGDATLSLLDQAGEPVYAIFQAFPIIQGENILRWDGTRADHSVIEPGEYTLRYQMESGTSVDFPLRIGAPYPRITEVLQNTPVIDEWTPMDITFTATEPGTVHVQLVHNSTGVTAELPTLSAISGSNSYQWAGDVDGDPIAAGEYAVKLTLVANNGSESMPQYVYFEAQSAQSAAAPDSEPTEGIVLVDVTPEPTPDPTPTPEPTPVPLSPPYSDAADGTFWSMTPGELDDAVIWDILTQPITVYDDGKITGTEHVYIMENADGSGAKLAQIHGKSQGLHVLGEENEHGYILVEAFSNYDPEYQPKTDEEREHAFEVKQGYILASGLKTIEVKQDIGFVIDKLTQRMYMYMDGKPVTEFLIATGKIADNKYYNETIAGEYMTVSHVGGFESGNMYCDMAIRINGGILLHEVPFKTNADGTRNYSAFEAYLGSKQSHGCVRIQRLKTPEGYNHRWLWENLDRKGGYKVIIWDDIGRTDTPTTWQENPKN